LADVTDQDIALGELTVAGCFVGVHGQKDPSLHAGKAVNWPALDKVWTDHL
jgi:hypothetical protein